MKRLDKHNMGPAQVLEWLDNLPKLKDRASYAHRFRQLGVEGEDLITFGVLRCLCQPTESMDTDSLRLHCF